MKLYNKRTGKLEDAVKSLISDDIAKSEVTTGDLIDAKSTLTVSETQVYTGALVDSWTDLDLSSVVGSNSALVILKVKTTGSAGNADLIAFRQNGDTDEAYDSAIENCANAVKADALFFGLVIVHTDTSGVVEWTSGETDSTCTIDVVAYIV